MRWFPKLLILLIMLAFVGSTGNGWASENSLASEPVDRISGHDRVFKSEVLGQDRPFSVLLPFDYNISNRRYPVLYVIDGDAYDAYVAEIVKLLSFQGETPPMIIVGISSINRDHDLTPNPAQDQDGLGGGRQFQEFLKSELVPFMDDQYRTDKMRILFGHSLGGIFAVYSLFEDPSLINAGLAISPALYYDRGHFLQTLEKTLQDGKSFKTNFLYMSVGNENGYAESLDFLTNLLEDHKPKGLRWEGHKFPDESHSSIVLRTTVLGLKALFRDFPLLVRDIEDGFDAVKKHYDNLSEILGYEVLIPEALVNRLGYRALADGDNRKAKRSFSYNVSKYPDSANVYDSLAEAYFGEKKFDEAMKYYKKTLELDPGNENAEMMLDRIRQMR